MRIHRLGIIGTIALACGGCGTPSASSGAGDPAAPPALSSTTFPTATPSFREILPADDPLQGGIYDPSLAYDAAGTGWLAYTSVEGPNGPAGPSMSTHLASSADRGLSWTFRAVINASFPGTVVLTDGSQLAGIWRCEVPALIYDPDDAAAPWKQLMHRYFWSPQRDRMPDYGWIGLRTAPTPLGPWSEEIALFGAGDVGGTRLPRPPYDQQRVFLDQLSPDLVGYVAYSEPGALVRGGVLYVSLVALRPDGPDGIVLLASGDHGASWRYVSTLATRADAQRLGFQSFDGSALAAHGAQAFLLVTPASAAAQHDGTLVLPFADLAGGRLRRDAGGALMPQVHVPCQHLSSFGGGQATYHELDRGGLIMPQLDPRIWPRWWRVYDTGVFLGPPPLLPNRG